MTKRDLEDMATMTTTWKQELTNRWIKKWPCGSVARVGSTVDTWRGKKRTRYFARMTTPKGTKFMDGFSSETHAKKWADSTYERLNLK